MEALSPTMEEGRVVKWLKRDGDPVKTGETLAEVETDKAGMGVVAREAGVDLKLVSGSGLGGRVVKRDVEGSASRALAPAAASAVVDSHPASRIPHPAPSGAPYDDVPLTQIRKTIAKRLATSLGPI